MKKIICKTNLEVWEMTKDLKQKGYKKEFDCYWFIGFKKDEEELIIERD